MALTRVSGNLIASGVSLTFDAGNAALPALTTTGDTNTGIFFPAADTIAFTEGGTECGRFNSSGNLQTIGTISVGNATPSTSGAGITFPADQTILGASTNANTLDDYEEGTWTPSFTSAGGGTAGTYTFRIGNYVKIGKLVTVQFYIEIASVGTLAAGGVEITGLPFTGENTSRNRWYMSGIWYFQTSGTPLVQLSFQVSPNSSTLTTLALPSAGTDSGPSNLTVAQCGSAIVVVAGNLSYTTA